MSDNHSDERTTSAWAAICSAMVRECLKRVGSSTTAFIGQGRDLHDALNGHQALAREETVHNTARFAHTPDFISFKIADIDSLPYAIDYFCSWE